MLVPPSLPPDVGDTEEMSGGSPVIIKPPLSAVSASVRRAKRARSPIGAVGLIVTGRRAVPPLEKVGVPTSTPGPVMRKLAPAEIPSPRDWNEPETPCGAYTPSEGLFRFRALAGDATTAMS